MKYLVVVVLVLSICNSCFGQKELIDSNAIRAWPDVKDPRISNDGKFVMYTIRNQPIGTWTLALKARNSNWEAKIPNAMSGTFTGDGQAALFILPDGNLSIIELGTDQTQYIPAVASFKVSNNIDCHSIAYLSKGASKELTLLNLWTKQTAVFDSVLDYIMGPNGNYLLLHKESKRDSVNGQELDLIDIRSGLATIIWHGRRAKSLVFAIDGCQLSFLAEEYLNSSAVNCVWYYRTGMTGAIKLIGPDLPGVEDGFELDFIQRFSHDGNKIFVALKEVQRQPTNSAFPKVDIWSYRDAKLQSLQLKELDPNFLFRPHAHFTSVIHIKDARFIQLEHENDRILESFGKESQEDVLVIESHKGDAPNEWNWNPAAGCSVYLISAKSGERKILNRFLSPTIAAFYRLCPDGKYVIYYDPKAGDYCSYEVSSGLIRNLTHGIVAKWTTLSRDDEPKADYIPLGIAGWLKGNGGVLVYDQYDIFQLDPTGKRRPRNLTNGYGRSHKIIFRLAMDNLSETIPDTGTLILSGFNKRNKDEGFCSINFGKVTDPTIFTMGPYLYKGTEGSSIGSFPPLKARGADTYLIRRMSEKESPNFFCTNDFKAFTSISDLYPEKKYNWLTTDLLQWKTPDGRSAQGILYKPQNFDRNKKYPILFFYYERLSDNLHAFNEPGFSTGTINIPYFVSNGYLVFTPDIHYSLGNPGKSACGSVASAARFLSQKPFINSKKMGIIGHSFGGYETDYIVSHTKLFSAACSAAGWPDFISAYGGIRENGSSRQGYYENYRERMGVSLWQKPELYIGSSPIFSADNVTTPLLMMNNKADDDVSFSLGAEFFTALRRLGRRVWMLQYDGEGHVVFDHAAEDFTIRLRQFFDHYLKDAPPPKWMTSGVPAKMKGRELGYELDNGDIKP